MHVDEVPRLSLRGWFPFLLVSMTYLSHFAFMSQAQLNDLFIFYKTFQIYLIIITFAINDKWISLFSGDYLLSLWSKQLHYRFLPDFVQD